MPTASARRRNSINADPPPKREGDRRRSRLGHLPPIVLCAGIGVLVCSLANGIARSTFEPPMLLFWAGILLIAVPIFWRLASHRASAGERFGLVCLLALSLFAVKVVRDAPLYTFPDEPIHAYNAQQIASHDELFRANPILTVTPNYPGLSGATAALMDLTGMSSYGAGNLVVGAARLVLMIALFLLFGRLSGSARAAGLGTAIYAGNFNFLYWGAQFAYESLALPLLVVVMMALAEREAAARDRVKEWAVPIVLGMGAVLVTHHLTSYALAAFLVALTAAFWLLRRTWRPPSPWPFAALAIVLAAGWLVIVASSTVGYISPVIGNAIEATIDTALGEAPPRTLFQGESDTPGPEAVGEAPTVARGISLLAIGLLAVTLPLGLWRVWRAHRREPFALIFALASLGFFGTLLLRLAPAAWETGNRASEFLFLGLAFVVALAAAAWRPRGHRRLGQALLTAGLAVVLVGGAISGWPWNSQLASPLRVAAGDGTIDSPPLGLAEWARETVPGGKFAANLSDARLLMAPGEKWAMTGTYPAIEGIIEEPALSDWELPLLRRRGLRYVVADRRRIGSDHMRGYFFSHRGAPAWERLLLEDAVTKFAEIPGAARIYANGNIAVYDLGARR